MSNYTPMAAGTGVRANIQRFGAHLAGMVMPNIGAFIAWGLITALFIPTGWLPNEGLAALVDPMILFLLPLLIGFTGGKMLHGHRGGVVGAVATMGVIVGTEVPMFLGAMIMGPLGGYLIKKWDERIEGKIKPGFEMLVDNFSSGIIGGALAIVGLKGAGPVVQWMTDRLGEGVDALVERNLLPLASVVIEPAKILFLNNAINQGILTPLGAIDAKETGQSILFMLESNPGPGLGILLAYMFFGPRLLRQSAPAAIIIQFLGGIHEIYFPYILMKPKLILAVIAGGAAGVATFQLTGAGLVASPSPGSIFAYIIQTPKGFGNYAGMIAGVVISTLVSFSVASALMGFGRNAEGDEEAIEEDMQEAGTA
ncbi:mannitol-specific PTS transporter subunit IIC [Aeromicrobium sp. CF3.5]|uniref:mannitol-specific PTS transporter subunit IIC n=1 Tax=Aeromicrobium sp. CF3.5 TaxID=3373078 RepID=UPI003EE7994B